MFPVTLESASSFFRSIGLKEGDIVELHGSLKAIGLVSGGPNTIIDALLKVLSYEGTLLMAAQYSTNSEPAHWQHPPVEIESFKLIRESHPSFKGKESYLNWMGSLAQTLQLKDQTMFSDHPNCAVMALGKQAKWLTMSSPISPAFGIDSPLEKAIQMKSKALLIGVDYSTLTGMHVAETLSNMRPYTLESATIKVNGKDKRVKILDVDTDSEIFNQIGAEYELTHEVKTLNLGNATVKLIEMSSLHEFTISYFKEHL